MIPTLCQKCQRVFIGFQTTICRKCNLIFPIYNLNELLLHFIQMPFITNFIDDFQWITIKRLLMIFKIFKTKILSSHHYHLYQFRKKLIWIRKSLNKYNINNYSINNNNDYSINNYSNNNDNNDDYSINDYDDHNNDYSINKYDDKYEFMEWIQYQFGSDDELLNIETTTQFFEWIHYYKYYKFDSFMLFHFCWNEEILLYLLKSDKYMNDNWLFYQCKDGYTILQWLYYHYEHHHWISKEELIRMLIRWNLIYLDHLCIYNTSNSNKWYDWLYVYDPEIDLSVYLYLMEYSSNYIQNFCFSDYVNDDQHNDLFNYFYLKKYDWREKYTSDYVTEYSPKIIISKEKNNHYLTIDLLSQEFFQKDMLEEGLQDKYMDLFASVIQTESIYYELSHYYLNKNIKKSIAFAVKAKDYTLAFNLNQSSLNNYKMLSTIKSDYDFIMFLLSITNVNNEC